MFIWYVVGFYSRPLLKIISIPKHGQSVRQRIALIVALIIICLILFPIMMFLTSRGYEWRGGPVLPVVALGTAMGIAWSLFLANLLACLPFAQLLALPGKCSFTIMAWHLGAFRVLSILRVLLTSATAKELLGSYVNFKGAWVIVYCLVGVLLPTIGKIYWDKGKDCLHKWINVKGTNTPDSN